MWPISGISSQSTAFQNRLQNLCWPLGDLSLQSCMTLTSGSGQAGVINGVVIPFHALFTEIVNFLALLHGEGYQSRSLNSFRLAISSVHDRVDGIEVGKHPMVARLLKGAFHTRPPLPRYMAVQVVLQYLEGLGPSTSLSLKLLTYKLVMLLALTRPSHSADLASLHLTRRQKEWFFFQHHWQSSQDRVSSWWGFSSQFSPTTANYVLLALSDAMNN